MFMSPRQLPSLPKDAPILLLATALSHMHLCRPETKCFCNLQCRDHSSLATAIPPPAASPFCHHCQLLSSQSCCWQPLLAFTALLPSGMVQAYVWHKVMPLTSSQGYFYTIFYIRWARDITSQSTSTQTTYKDHHHGDGAACPSSGVDSMNPRPPSGKRPCAFIFRGRCWRVWLNSIN